MKTRTLVFICSILLFGFTSKTDYVKKTEGQWTYCDGVTFKFLSLESSGTYHYLYDSCKGDTELKGRFSIKGDTLILLNSDIENSRSFLFQKNNILSFSKSFGQFSEFQPLKKTSAKNLNSAIKNCDKKRTKKRR